MLLEGCHLRLSVQDFPGLRVRLGELYGLQSGLRILDGAPQTGVPMAGVEEPEQAIPAPPALVLSIPPAEEVPEGLSIREVELVPLVVPGGLPGHIEPDEPRLGIQRREELDAGARISVPDHRESKGLSLRNDSLPALQVSGLLHLAVNAFSRIPIGEVETGMKKIPRERLTALLVEEHHRPLMRRGHHGPGAGVATLEVHAGEEAQLAEALEEFSNQGPHSDSLAVVHLSLPTERVGGFPDLARDTNPSVAPKQVEMQES